MLSRCTTSATNQLYIYIPMVSLCGAKTKMYFKQPIYMCSIYTQPMNTCRVPPILYLTDISDTNF